MSGTPFREQLIEIRGLLSGPENWTAQFVEPIDWASGGYPVTRPRLETDWESLEWMPLPGFTDVEFWRRRYEELSKARRDGPLAWDKPESE
jgi:hypothetical protein